MMEIVELRIYAPIPVGHRVSIVPIETSVSPLFGGPAVWTPNQFPLVCDEVTRIIYTDRSIPLHSETTYEQVRFKTDETRISQTQPAIRGIVRACLALCDYGDTVHFHTTLRIETGPQLT